MSETASPPRIAVSPILESATDPAVRAVAAAGLIAAGIIHALEIQGQLSGAVWLTIGFCLLAVAQPLAGLWLLTRPTAMAWAFGGLACLLAALGYMLTRSVPVPGDTGDVGNWLEPLGVVSLIVQWITVLLSGIVLAGELRVRRYSH